MKAISIRQPWAWLIVNGYKDIENRTWSTRYRGPVLIHASKGVTIREYQEALAFAISVGFSSNFPKRDDLERGGIVGVATIIDSVTQSNSRWYTGAHGFVLRDARPLPFTTCKGALGFFEVPPAVTSECACEQHEPADREDERDFVLRGEAQ